MSRRPQGVAPSELGRPTPAVEEPTVLAAVGRAALHERAPGRRGKAELGTISAHLGWVYDGAATRILRPHLESLVSQGVLEASEHRRTPLWAPTEAGRRLLARGPRPPLPESPQRRRWRHDRIVARAELEALRDRAEVDAAEAARLLAEEPLRSDPLAEVGRRLSGALSGLAAAIDVSSAWPEPEDGSGPDEGRPSGAGVLYLHVDKKRREELIHAAVEDRP